MQVFQQRAEGLKTRWPFHSRRYYPFLWQSLTRTSNEKKTATS